MLQEINEDYVFSYIDSRKEWIDGIVVSGGEPTLQKGLEDFLEKCKKKGISVKLDTNGSNYKVLENLLQKKIVDYVAMDIKGPPSLYSVLTGKKGNAEDVEKGMLVVMQFPDYEFRTTIVPLQEKEETKKEKIKLEKLPTRWPTEEEIEEMARWVIKVTGKNNHKYFLQRFVSREEDEMLDERFCKYKLPKEMWETPYEVVNNVYDIIKKYLPNVATR